MGIKERISFIRIIETISNASLAVMFLTVMLGVISRYIMSRPFVWTDELSRYLMIYMVFLGGTISFRAEKHPSLNFLIDKLPPRWRFVWDSGIDVLLMLVLLFLVFGGWEMVTHKPIGRTPALRVKYSWIYLAIPLGSLCMFAETVMRFIRRIKLNRAAHLQEDVVREESL
ncbi:TRAP transporter small permease [Sphaerochaeta halotolerans]|uniref:TRAP transporter small permease n=1 Tax=Sphaerochaeta halotolerans TaxID=2293840 RepID=A0A372MEY7_9SPIR|nr:TRAP transporter small permease [Sphaerochaeta halotolerans]RFU93770.1 TRAP transporter small permease [Sphaerochaeta halotolerans]